jgi:hypothetical protein
MLSIKTSEIGTQKMIDKLEKAKNINFTDVGKLIRKKMIQVIDDERIRDKKKPSERWRGKYTKHIKDVIEVVVTKDGVGIANIDKLDTETPYWYKINNGGVIEMKGKKVSGKFTDGKPGEGGNTASFIPGPGAPLNVDLAPIAPMNYIEKTGFWVKQNIWKYVLKAMFND